MRDSLEVRKKNKEFVNGKRRFLGPLFPRDEKIHNTLNLEMNEYENMQKKHLKAYLRGDKFFFYKKQRFEVEAKFGDRNKKGGEK